MNSNKCKHGFYTYPNGYHIFPKTEKRDIRKEAERLYNKEFPKTEPKPRQQPNINQIKKFSALLENISKY